MDWNFWKAALIRAARTAAQGAIAAIGTTALINEVNWLSVLSMAGMSAVLSLLTSIATGLPECEHGVTIKIADDDDEPVQDE